MLLSMYSMPSVYLFNLMLKTESKHNLQQKDMAELFIKAISVRQVVLFKKIKETKTQLMCVRSVLKDEVQLPLHKESFQ